MVDRGTMGGWVTGQGDRHLGVEWLLQWSPSGPPMVPQATIGLPDWPSFVKRQVPLHTSAIHSPKYYIFLCMGIALQWFKIFMTRAETHHQLVNTRRDILVNYNEPNVIIIWWFYGVVLWSVPKIRYIHTWTKCSCLLTATVTRFAFQIIHIARMLFGGPFLYCSDSIDAYIGINISRLNS